MILWLDFNDNAILGHLLLDEDRFLDTTNDKVAARIVRTLLDLGQLIMIHLREPAI